MNNEQLERVETLGRNIVNSIVDIIDSDYQLQERAEMVEPLINENHAVMNNVRGICYEEGTFPSPDPVRNTKAAYEPVITQVNNGFTVRCGCQTFVFETFDKMSKYLKMYFENPAETEEKFYKNELF